MTSCEWQNMMNAAGFGARRLRVSGLLPLALVVFGAAFVSVSGTAHAGDQPLYRPLPDWVLPAKPADTANQPTQRVYDIQERYDHGEMWFYVDNAAKIDTPEALTKSGTVTAEWAPDHGDLIVHGVDILRGGKRIDVLAAGAKFTVLRREAQLESLALNGNLTATLEVEGLQVGDIIETRISITQRDPALQGHVGGVLPLYAAPMQIGYGRVRALWRDGHNLRWKNFLDGVTPSLTAQGGWHELSVSLPVAKQPDPAAQAPGRFAHPAMVEFSDFADWADVSRTMAPLYRLDASINAIKPGGDLDGEVAKIATATTDPRRRVALSLQLVQDKVRYFAISMNGGNLVPQTPEQTWAKRYGDCKAKTLLMLAILHKLGIDAEPALANLENGDLVHERLPSVGAFNHIFVLAHMGGKTLWLDGTGLGTREADLDDVPPYRWVLPLRATGAELLQSPARPPARANSDVFYETDMRGGIGFITPGHIHVIARGAGAGQLNAQLANLDKEAKADVLRKTLINQKVRRVVLQPQFAYDPATGIATIDADCLTWPQWKRADNRYSFNPGIFEASQYPERSRSIWQVIPVTMGTPSRVFYDLKYRLPEHGEGIAMEGSPELQLTQAGLGSTSLHAGLRDGIWHYTGTDLKDGGEFPASAIPAMRRQDAEMVAKAPKLRSIAGYPAPWQGVEQAKLEHLYDRAIALFGQYIAEKPEDADRYWLRAGFYASIFERQKAIDDLGKTLALKADKAVYDQRASLYEALGNIPAALADVQAEVDLDPSNLGAMSWLTRLMARTGGKDAALERIDAALANGGDKEPFYLEMKAHVLAHSGDTKGAIAEIDAAIEKRSGNAGLLKDRCWLKGLLNTDLDNALADCTRAIQLSEAIAAPTLHGRALVQLRLRHLPEAAADLKAAIDIRPNDANDHFLLALVEREAGQAEAAKRDIAAARLLMPAVQDFYAPFGLRW